jgi:hypothetical protein
MIIKSTTCTRFSYHPVIKGRIDKEVKRWGDEGMRRRETRR